MAIDGGGSTTGYWHRLCAGMCRAESGLQTLGVAVRVGAAQAVSRGGFRSRCHARLSIRPARGGGGDAGWRRQSTAARAVPGGLESGQGR